MKLNRTKHKLYIPDSLHEETAIKRTTHMAIGAHQDDLEIMAYHGIQECFQAKDKYFFGCVVTNGSGSARNNIYEHYTDKEMMEVRKKEQKKAAHLGEYTALALLDFPSKDVKTPHSQDVVDELKELILIAQPEILYTHNLTDKHDTHVAVALKVIKALRSIPKEKRPTKVYGCEIWRNLDWVNDDEKIYLDVSKHPNLAASLVEIFDSQVIGGKRYDLATIGRRLANATFNASHAVDEESALSYAMDLTPLIEDETLDIVEYITLYIERFKIDVKNKLEKYM
ncbi:PIG-L deacetylase family protein [Candidatus Izemoplasma sp. B36]|uniref:PIG-L deacetylase family protein n=1 Tax=Candidatus Izemoplasma sp. B36 TaxID=3242468 RepID=UPI003555DB14